MQERLIEEIEAPFARYCADMSDFSFGRGFLELKEKLEGTEGGKVDSSFSSEAGMDCHEFDKSNSRNDEKYAIGEKVDSSTAETLSELAQDSRICDEASGNANHNAGGRVGEKVDSSFSSEASMDCHEFDKSNSRNDEKYAISEKVDSSTAETLSELAQDSRICDEKSGLSSDWLGSYLSGNDCRQSRRIHDLSRKAESTRNAKLFQKMQEINAYIKSFSPTHDELLKVLSLGQEMFDHISRAKPFAQFTQASDLSEQSDMANQLISLYAAVITSLSGDEEDDLWGSSDCISQWRHQWLFNTGLTLPLQVCMMKHLQSIFGIEPANFSTALSKLAKDAAHKYRIIGLDEEAQPSPASFFGFFNVPTHQSPESPLSGVYGHILRDIGERYSELLAECAGDREKLESSIEDL